MPLAPQPADVLAWADRIGVTLSVMGDRVRYAPREAASPEFVAALIEHKAALLRLLNEPELTAAAIADAVDACLRLGKRLRDGEFRSLRCGITGRECPTARACRVPAANRCWTPATQGLLEKWSAPDGTLLGS